jgi:hypothetical protein
VSSFATAATFLVVSLAAAGLSLPTGWLQLVSNIDENSTNPTDRITFFNFILTSFFDCSRGAAK